MQFIFLESLRLYPPVPISNRVATHEYKIPETDKYSKKVFIPLLGAQRNPNYYPERSKFIPE